MRNAVGQTVLVAGQVGGAEALPEGALRRAHRTVRRRRGSIEHVILQRIGRALRLPLLLLPRRWPCRLLIGRGLLLLLAGSKAGMHREAGALAWPLAGEELYLKLSGPPRARLALLIAAAVVRGGPAQLQGLQAGGGCRRAWLVSGEGPQRRAAARAKDKPPGGKAGGAQLDAALRGCLDSEGAQRGSAMAPCRGVQRDGGPWARQEQRLAAAGLGGLQRTRED